MRSNARFPSRLRILVLGYIVRGPLGGLVWHHLQYVMGLARLGHDVYFLEDSGDSPWCCYDPARHVTDSDPTFGLTFARDVFALGGLQDRWSYYDAHRRTWLGPCADRITDIIAGADLALNVSGINTPRPWFERVPHRALIDTDPAFTQIRNLTDPAARAEADAHTSFFSFAENIGRPGCSVPDDGIPWQPTRQPIVIDMWPVVPPRRTDRFTTVMQWDSYPAREYDGRRYGMKSDSFGRFLDLPSRVDAELEIAVGGETAEHVLKPAGWMLRDPLRAFPDPESYRRYLQESSGEFTVAKHGYVATRSGWFSERSAAYLASGRPVVTENTGFTDWLPSGTGVMPFSTVEEAVHGIESVKMDYSRHCKTARLLADAYFAAPAVLDALIARAMTTETTDVGPFERALS